jgi:hypothetical protein
MTEPLRWDSKVLLVEIEATYGVDPTPTQAMLVKNVTCKPMEGEDVSRDVIRPFRGSQEVFPVGLRTVLEFDLELVGSGELGVAPPISPVLRACGLAEVVSEETDVTYTPISAGYESAAVYFWIGGNKQAMLGCRGTAAINISAQTVPTIHVTLTGLWSKPVVAALPAIDLSAFMDPLVSTNVNTPIFTVAGVPLVMRSYSLDFANDVQARFLIGRDTILIDDSAEKISMVVEAVPLATYDPFAVALARTKQSIIVQQDTRAGHKVTVTTPLCQIARPSGYTNQQKIIEWPLQAMPLPSDAGNDQFSIVMT